MDRINILYFLEDLAQEQFIVALVERIASDLSVPARALSHHVRSARGGSLRVIGEFGEFVRDRRKAGIAGAEMIVVAVDGDCKGSLEMAKQLMKKVKDTDPFRDTLAFAIPDPHVERWYLLDQEALKKGSGLQRGIEPPPYKSKKDYYKTILRNALDGQGILSSLGGSEFGVEIAHNISHLYELGKQDPSFAKFVEDVKRILQRSISTDLDE